ncbi:virulence RhuM family protein [Dyadobacter sp. LJ53]|uniref:virulence RhuM family protein n=1 Tax=Dyadobacter chenwenxiniae TaxID=2906456 RepID=UPI001F234963|nr:virulence RhuM family protein [Dyadobacter chenwenxiniae]MCF0052591.1 virulence RhuM family protein [Dyadobacter chenwenxiniae]
MEVIIGDETVWLNQQSISEIFGVDRSVITKHLKNIFSSGELDEEAVCAKNAHTASDGKTYQIKYYNLDAIISVGYRVSSQQATHFRIWASKVLKEFLVKGFALDDERLKHGKNYFGKDYFDELIDRVREIRASERRFYQKITDIYAQCSIDYSPNSSLTQTFYAMVQNKLEWAITGMTASEIIKTRANALKPFMGLTTWKNAPTGGKILKPDIKVAKNYLTEKEITELNLVVNMYLDYAELQANKKVPMKMSDWIIKLDSFLKFNEYDILKDAGKVSHEVACSFAEKEFQKFRVVQDKTYESDFDRVLNKKTISGKADKGK